MCDHCGCSETKGFQIHSGRNSSEQVHDQEHSHPHHHDHAHDHPHDHAHDHPHDHAHDHDSKVALEQKRIISINRGILEKNDRQAERNRGFLAAKGVLSLNLLSSPGSGKTSLLERTISDMGKKFQMNVIVGDLATQNDAERMRKHGIQAIQITTGSVCHLDSEMVARALGKLNLDHLDILFMENVGNLVCPAVYDLGEDLRSVIFSVTEGEDKPLKYPLLFQSASLICINKMDLLNHLDFSLDLARENIRKVNGRAELIEVSAKTGQGMDSWYAFLQKRLAEFRSRGLSNPHD